MQFELKLCDPDIALYLIMQRVFFLLLDFQLDLFIIRVCDVI